jgi:hypothetical protein
VLKALNKTIAEVFDIPATGFFVAIGPTNQIQIFSRIYHIR